jgi:hypothetical protein
MSLGLRDDRRRRRQRVRLAIVRWLIAGGAVIAVAAYAYQTGARVAQRDAASRERQISALSASLAELESLLQAQQADLSAERANAEQWRQRYERDVPTGEARELLQVLRARIDAGVEPQRLRWVLSQMGPRRDCDPRAEVRRVLVRTPTARGAQTATPLSGGALSVTLDGSSAKDEKGNPESWFDPARPVTLRLTTRNGKTIESEGLLPLQHSAVEGNREYRLSVVTGPGGSVNVSVERCRFP